MTGALHAMDVRGARGATIADAWADGPVTYLGLGVAGFPNLFTVNGPGSPSVLANMVVHASSRSTGAWTWSPPGTWATPGRAAADAAEKWTEHLGEVAAGTLFTRAASWYMGANIEGKKRVFMPYIGGFGNYRRICDEVRDTGFEGLRPDPESRR